jgi:hypothetical protein
VLGPLRKVLGVERDVLLALLDGCCTGRRSLKTG